MTFKWNFKQNHKRSVPITWVAGMLFPLSRKFEGKNALVPDLSPKSTHLDCKFFLLLTTFENWRLCESTTYISDARVHEIKIQLALRATYRAPAVLIIKRKTTEIIWRRSFFNVCVFSSTQVDKTWRDLMRRTEDRPNALRAATGPGVLESLQACNTSLEKIQKSLEVRIRLCVGNRGRVSHVSSIQCQKLSISMRTAYTNRVIYRLYSLEYYVTSH